MNMSNATKEQDPSYKQPVFADFSPPKTTTPKAPPKPTQNVVFSLERVKSILEKSYRDGYSRGMKEGYANGLDLAKQEMANEKNCLLDLASQFTAALEHKSEKISEEILNLALEIAKTMVKTQIQIKPEVILPIIDNALKKIPITHKSLLITLHPHDANIVRKHLQEELSDYGWSVLENTTIEPGGCFVETATNTINASNQTRWQSICQSLNQHNDWIEDGK
jgi:flagellar assembly protein FliH